MGQKNGCIFRKGSSIVVPEAEKNVELGTLSSNQMDSLTAICDTILPSIDANSFYHQEAIDDPFTNFLQTSASMTGTPQHVRGFFWLLVTSPLPLCFFLLFEARISTVYSLFGYIS